MRVIFNLPYIYMRVIFNLPGYQPYAYPKKKGSYLILDIIT